MCVLQPRQQAHQQTNAAAVDEIDLAEVEEDVPIHGEQIVDVLLELGGLCTLDNPPAAFDDGDVTDAAALKRERHVTSLRPGRVRSVEEPFSRTSRESIHRQT